MRQRGVLSVLRGSAPGKSPLTWSNSIEDLKLPEEVFG